MSGVNKLHTSYGFTLTETHIRCFPENLLCSLLLYIEHRTWTAALYGVCSRVVCRVFDSLSSSVVAHDACRFVVVLYAVM